MVVVVVEVEVGVTLVKVIRGSGCGGRGGATRGTRHLPVTSVNQMTMVNQPYGAVGGRSWQSLLPPSDDFLQKTAK